MARRTWKRNHAEQRNRIELRFFFRQRAQLFAFHFQQRLFRRAPLCHPGALFFRCFGQLHRARTSLFPPPIAIAAVLNVATLRRRELEAKRFRMRVRRLRRRPKVAAAGPALLGITGSCRRGPCENRTSGLPL